MPLCHGISPLREVEASPKSVKEGTKRTQVIIDCNYGNCSMNIIVPNFALSEQNHIPLDMAPRIRNYRKPGNSPLFGG